MSYEVGTAFLQIAPSFSGVVEAISAEAAKWGESAGSTFSDTFKARVDAALKSLPDAKIGVDATEADAKLAQIRADLESLSGANVGVDLSDAEATAKLDVLKAQLDELGAKNPSIKVEVNAASAELELAAVAVEADVVGKGLVDVGNSSGGASGGLSSLSSSAEGAAGGMSPLIGGIIALGAALIPIGGLAAGALATLPALIAGATTGLGALYLGFTGIPGALQAFSATQKAPVGSGSSAGTALSNATAERNAANSVQSAEEALNNARINGAHSVASAEQAAAATRVTASQSVATAENNLTSAEQTAATTRVTANQAIITAENALVNAERTVTQAQYAEAQAQDAVVTARENAQRQLDDYTNQLADAGLAARQAALDVTTTKAALDAANAPGSGASSSQLLQAQLTYDQALQRVKDLQTQNQQLTQDAQAAQAAGVDGNASVLSAEHQLAIAKQATIDATAAQQAAVINITTVTLAGDQQIILADAAVTQAKSAITAAILAGNKQIIQSEEAVVQAKRSTTQSISDAQRSLEQALASQADAFARAAIPTGTGATAMKAYETALAGLTPAGREFVGFVTGTLYPVFEGLKAKIQEAFLPLIQTGLTDLMPFFKDLGPMIEIAAKGIGGTFVELSKFMGSKTGLAEIMQIFKEGNGFMAAMGGNFVTIFEAFTGVGAQAGPIVKALSDGITSMVNDFAKWVSGGGFEKFMAWLKENGPGLVLALEKIIVGIGKFVVVLAPIGVVIDKLLGYLGLLVGWLSSTWQRFSEVAAIIGIAGVIIAGVVDAPIALLIGAIALIGVGVAELLTHWREVWAGIKNDADIAWRYLDQYLVQPISNFFTKTIPSIFSDAVGFFKDLPGNIVTALGDIVGTIFHGLLGAAKWVTDNVITPVIGFFKTLPGNIVTALGDIVGTIFHALLNSAKWVTDHVITPIVGFFKALPGNIVKALGDIVGTIWSLFVLAKTWLDDNIGTPIISFFGGLPGKIVSAARGMWHGISDAFREALNTIIGWWDELSFSIPPIVVLGVTLFPGVTVSVPQIPKFHDGGVVQGPPGIEQLAWLMPGEIVTPAQAAIPGGGSSRVITFAPVFNGVDLSNATIVENIVTRAFTRFADELEPMRIV